MGFHTFDPARAERLDDPTRFRFCSREELLQHLPGEADATVLDIGSGTGFYTDELAPFFDRVVGVDVQPQMHELYREKGVPENVWLLAADADSLPFADGAADGAVSTMTFHESTTPASLSELQRALSTDSPFVVVDWSKAGSGESGPPLEERFDATQAQDRLAAAGFTVEHAAERSETFAVVARA